MKRKKYSTEQKLAILAEVKEKGLNITLEKHGIYPATYYGWKKKLETMGKQGFAHNSHNLLQLGKRVVGYPCTESHLSN